MPKKTKFIAIKNFDEELYRIVKVYASLEGRTIASIFEEALQHWIENKREYNEVYAWTLLEREYTKNIEALKREIARKLKSFSKGYALVCNGMLIGVFKEYIEAAEKSKEVCGSQAIIVELPYKEEERELRLGLPW